MLSRLTHPGARQSVPMISTQIGGGRSPNDSPKSPLARVLSLHNHEESPAEEFTRMVNNQPTHSQPHQGDKVSFSHKKS